ncbi:hypothetical protein ACS0TY_034563 [Phlomoides rotata]
MMPSYATLIHILTIKLNSSNYLLWCSQLLPLLTKQGLIDLFDGTRPEPPTEIMGVDGKLGLNPTYTKWHTDDQRLISLLFSFLIEEMMSSIVGCTITRATWLSLETTFNQHSKAHEL